MSVSTLKSSSLPSASVVTGFLKYFLGSHPLLPATYGKCGLTTLCGRSTTIRSSAKIWRPPSSRYFSKSHHILSPLPETSEQPSSSYSANASQPPGTDEQGLKFDRGDINFDSKSARKASRSKKPEVPRSSKSTTQKREKPDTPRELEPWQIQKQALKKKFPEGWNPRKRLHPDTLDTIRHLHQQDPTTYSTPALAQEFKVSPEAIRRILKSKWQPSPEVAAERRERWEKRRKRIWSHLSEIGVRPHRPSFADASDAKVLEKKRRTVGSK
ncbi:required for respiratory growth protein 9, mitochondrial [Blastomyces percursus]|uniref:Required for respiratory growth protein 9, mitochondrial n=1 Tax=Blastomyces percursus TaxID=1658174 RepID=A0A1J9Q4L8_9EURO|nr:required for respiratory growth protein 9, mitochondrial [Blastomyces percursus]